MALTIQSIQDVQNLLQQHSQPYQALSVRDPRLMRYRDLLIGMLGNAIGRQLTQGELELVDMGMSLLVEQDFLPGIYSGGKQYNEILDSLLSMAGARGGSTYNDVQRLQQISNLAYNTSSTVNEYLYRNDGTLNFQFTRGLDAKLASQLSSRALGRAVRGREFEDISNTLSFGSNSFEMKRHIQEYIRQGDIQAGSELHRRLVQQQREIEALETEAIVRFRFRSTNEEEIVNRVNGEERRDKVTHDLDAGLQMRLGNEVIETEAEFSALSETNQRRVALSYYQQLLDNAEAIREGDSPTGRIVDYYIRDEEGNRLYTTNVNYDAEGNKTESKEELRLSHILNTGLNSPEVLNAIKNKTNIRGVSVSQTSANILREMTRFGDTTETVLDREIVDSTFRSLADTSENVRFISKAFNLDDMDKVEAVAKAMGLGDILHVDNASNIRNHLEDLRRMAISQNRDIKELMKERADLVEALAVDFGGVDYVNKDFASRVQRVLNNMTIAASNSDNPIPLKSREEITAEMSRSRSNAENLFGGFAIAEYALANFTYMGEDTNNKLQEYVRKGREALEAGDRRGAYLYSERAKALVEETLGAPLSHAHARRAQAQYGYTDYELSVNSGLQEQIRYNYRQQMRDGVLSFNPTQRDTAELQSHIVDIKNSEFYRNYMSIQNDTSLTETQRAEKTEELIKNNFESYQQFAQAVSTTLNIRPDELDPLQRLIQYEQAIISRGGESITPDSDVTARGDVLADVVGLGDAQRTQYVELANRYSDSNSELGRSKVYYKTSDGTIQQTTAANAIRMIRNGEITGDALISEQEIKNNTQIVRAREDSVQTYLKSEEEFLLSIVGHTGSSVSSLQAITDSYARYKDIADEGGTATYNGQRGQVAAEQWLTQEYANTLRTTRGYSEEMVVKTINIIRNMHRMQADPEKLESYLAAMLQNTGTIVEGSDVKAQEWLSVYNATINPQSDKSLDMGIPELIIAGIVGDGSDTLDEGEASAVRYRRWLSRQTVDGENGQKSARASDIQALNDYFFSDAEDGGGAQLKGYAIETFSNNGSFGEQESIQNLIKDQVETKGAQYDADRDIFTSGEYEGLTSQQAYNRQYAISLLNDERLAPILQELGVNNEEQKNLFVQRLTQGGAAYLYEHYLKPNNYSIRQVDGIAYFAKNVELQRNATELNKEFESLTRVDFQRYFRTDNEIDKSEYVDLLSQLYGIELPTMEALLTDAEKVDSSGKFRHGTGVLVDFRNLDHARQWFFSDKAPDENAINTLLGSDKAYEILYSGNTDRYKELASYNAETGKFRVTETVRNENGEDVNVIKEYTADQILSRNISERYKGAYIDSILGKGTYEKITSGNTEGILDENGNIVIEGQYKGRNIDSVIAQFARGVGLDSDQFLRFIQSESGLQIDFERNTRALQEQNILNAEGRFVSGIFEGKTLEEAHTWLGETSGVDGLTNAELLYRAREQQQQAGGGTEQALQNIISKLGGIADYLKQIASNTRPTSDAASSSTATTTAPQNPTTTPSGTTTE